MSTEPKIPERGSTHIYKVRKIDKEAMDSIINLCVYEQPPFCNAACPLKLDTRALMTAVSENDFKKALNIYEKATPFPIILSTGCEAPCESRCRMGEVGDHIEIKKIENAVARFGEWKKSGGVFRMKKKKTVAVFGTDLFTLFLAGELEKKMYPVTVFTPASNLEEYLSSVADFLSDEEHALEYKRLKAMDIDFEFSSDVTPEFFAEKHQNFDVVCASEAVAKLVCPEAVCSEDIMVYEEKKLVMGCGSGVMNAAFGAKKAALSVDRLAQNLSPRNMRGEEGIRESSLYTNMSEAAKLSRVEADGEYTREQAVEEAGRCIRCHCEECFKSCAFLQNYKKHPGLLGREIFNNTQIIMGDHPLNIPLNSCNLCGQCTVTCPNGFDMAKVCKMAKENMVATDKMALAYHEFGLLDMLFSNDEAFLARPQPGYDKCKYVFFPGCQATAIAPETVKAAYLDLCERLEGGVALMLGCCGAICDWAGRYEMYDDAVAFIDRELDKLSNPVIIAGCPTCHKELSGHENVEVKGIWDVLNEIGLPEGAARLDRPFAMHDSCGARGNHEMQEAVRKIAAELGCRLVDTPYSGDSSPCCGYGGLVNYVNPELAEKMTDKCLERSEEPYISYCMACRDRFAREGRQSRHILELVYGTDAGNPPDISEKRYNRLTLKQGLLKELWQEDTENVDIGFEINYTPEALVFMDKRLILKSDVIEVLKHIRETGEAIYDSESGLCIGNLRIGNATFWVKFTEDDLGYTVHSAYSHRMTVEKREG